MRPVIYQLFVRHFSNFKNAQTEWGSLEENGCGTFADVNDAALSSLAQMGITHLWLTGILKHASQATSPRNICKGIAGSPYAVSDYFDVDADLALNKEARLEEFQALLARVRRWGMVPLIDFIPNHVARDYESTIRPELNFGAHDYKHCFFTRDNSFYYLSPSADGPPLTLPEGVFEPEREHGRVTGNNAATWTPSAYDWYETVKLNYGLNFHQGSAATQGLAGILSSPEQTPRTWQIMDEVLAYWQGMGVGGFRCDMAHMIPMAFWAWASARCRLRDSQCFLMAEGYNDHMKLTEQDVHCALLASGFDAVYDSHSYDQLRRLAESNLSANALDACHQSNSPLYYGGVRYLENHDEPRLCATAYWGGHGEKLRLALTLAQYGSSCGPVLFYNGQEFGERAEGPGGFGGDNGRTSIFDYTHLPRLQEWSQQGRYDGAGLSHEARRELKQMGQLLRLLQSPAFADGEFYGLNWSNQQTPNYGHSFYAFLRHHRKSQSTYLVVCNLSPTQDVNEVGIHIPRNAQEWCGKRGRNHLFSPLLGVGERTQCTSSDLESSGLCLSLPAGQAALYKWEQAEATAPLASAQQVIIHEGLKGQAPPMQQMAHEWFGCAIGAPLHFSFAIEGEHLVFRAARNSPALNHPEAQSGQFQEELWRYDAAEFFLCTPDMNRYLEFNLSPNGAWWASVFKAPRVLDEAAPAIPQDTITCQAEPLGQGWAASARIPLSYLKKLGLVPQESRLAATAILDSPQQLFLSTANDLSGMPDFHRLSSWPLSTAQTHE